MIRSSMADIPEENWERAFGKKEPRKLVSDGVGGFYDLDLYRKGVQIDTSVPQRIPPNFERDNAENS